MPQRFQKVYLVNSAQSQFTRPPAGLAFMAGVCEQQDIDHKILDLNLEFLKFANEQTWHSVYSHAAYDLSRLPKDLEDKVNQYLDLIIEKITAYAPDCVALHVLTYLNQQWALRFLQRLRSCCDATIIAGGPGISVPRYLDQDQSTSFGRYLAMNNLLDFYAFGEGDIIFRRFLQGYRDDVGLNTANGPETWHPQLEDLSDLSLPSYKNIAIRDYYSPNQTPVLSITGSRGCVRRCTFCDVGHYWKKYRFRSGKDLANEILKHWQDTGALNYWFTDSLINGSLKQFNDLQTHLIELSMKWPELSSIKYSGAFIIRPKGSHPEKMFQMMKDTGCNHIHVGIESGSESVRNHMGKKFSNADIDYHFEMCEKYQIQNWMLMIVGYPTETEQDFQDSIEMLSKYQKYIINNTAFGLQLSRPASVLPNTPIYQMMEDLGIEHTGHVDQSQQWTVATNPHLTINERYRRWSELTRIALELGYNLPAEVAANLSMNKKSWQDHLQHGNSNTKKINIALRSNYDILS